MTLPWRLWLRLGALSLGLVACSGSPEKLGITGPGMGGPAAMSSTVAPPAPDSAVGTGPAQDDTLIQPPGTPTDFGNRYSPTVGPSFGTDGRYYGYN